MNEDLLRDFHAACRREIAAAAMAGMLANAGSDEMSNKSVVRSAVTLADALLAELGYPYPAER